MAFIDNLASLPETEGSRLKLLDEEGSEVAEIENAPGTAGSFRIYAYLAAKHGEINAEAAQEGLSIYAEHTDDAYLNPGKHPNIDRLVAIQSSGKKLRVMVE